MSNIRDIRRKARRDLHQAMRVAAYYLPPGSNAPVLLHVRDHTKFQVNAIEGAVRSGNGQMVDRQQMTPSIIFMRDELAARGITLLRQGTISIERGEAYTLDHAEAPDDITIKWNVTPITIAGRLATLPVPEVG